MVRDLRRLADTRFDLLVVGAGFYGAAAAWDAAARGLSVAIVDRDDFGAATSFNNLKTLHGGLRSLQALNLSQMRLFIRERRALARVAPHLVRPLPFVVPTYRHPKRSATLMRLALALNDVVAHDRNQGLPDPAAHLPASRVLSRAECLRLNPVIDPKGVTGGALWHDYQMHNADRMTLSFLLSAWGAGAAAANYAEVTRLRLRDRRVEGAEVTDRLTGETFDVQARVVLNAAGPWAAALLEPLPLSGRPAPAPRLSRAMNLVVRRIVDTHACGGLVAGRFLFLVPWRDVSMLGTSHDAHEGGPDQLSLSRWDLEAFLADAREAFPHAALSSADVQLVHRGLLPMVRGEGARVQLLRESVVTDHRRQGLDGLVSMFGVRYTTARATAARAVDAVVRQLGHDPRLSETAERPVAGGAITSLDSFMRAASLRDVAGLSGDALRRLVTTYGTTYDHVLRIVRDQPDTAAPLGRDCQVTGAEIVHAVRHEAAVHLSDALIRRTEAGSAGHPGAEAVERAAALMAAELGWDDWRMREEVANVEAFYRLPA